MSVNSEQFRPTSSILQGSLRRSILPSRRRSCRPLGWRGRSASACCHSRTWFLNAGSPRGVQAKNPQAALDRRWSTLSAATGSVRRISNF